MHVVALQCICITVGPAIFFMELNCGFILSPMQANACPAYSKMPRYTCMPKHCVDCASKDYDVAKHFHHENKHEGNTFPYRNVMVPPRSWDKLHIPYHTSLPPIQPVSLVAEPASTDVLEPTSDSKHCGKGW